MKRSRPIFTCALALWLVAFTMAWCCCLAGVHASTASAEASSADTLVTLEQDHSCCSNADQLPASSVPADSAPVHEGDCGCQGKLLQAPADQRSVVPASHASVDQLPAFQLPRLTFHWLAPLPLSVDHDASPPASRWSECEDSLLGLSCQLTI